MVIYEVSLFIEDSIFSAYKAWLGEHIPEMLTLNGFMEAKLLSDSVSSGSNLPKKGEKKLIVQYLIESIKDLNDYFDHSANVMRQKSIEKFGGKFRAERRILDVYDLYSRKLIDSE